MKRIALLALFLAGCDSVPHAWSEADLKALAREEQRHNNQILVESINKLEARLNEIEGKADIAQIEARLNGEAHDSLVKTFNKNVDNKNREAVRDMTRNGVCGSKMVEVFNDAGYAIGWRKQNNECTLADLGPAK